MADKKPSFPSKSCPKCGKLIHACSLKHEQCGWVAGETAGPVSAKKRGRPKKRRAAPASAGAANGTRITLEDIQAVKALVNRLGAEKVLDLARVLAK